MKKYNRPEILIENINVEDILAVSIQNIFDFDLDDSASTFDDLWGNKTDI